MADPYVNTKLEQIDRLLRLILLSSGSSLPTTDVATTLVGNTIGTTNRYLELFTNRYSRMVSVKVAAEFVIPGSTVKLSLQSNDNGVIDTLSSTGKTTSETILLPPNATLWINTANTAFSLNGSVFRVLLFDGIGYIPKTGK